MSAARGRLLAACSVFSSLSPWAGLTPHRTNFIITTSVDGHLKLWKKQDTGIEFVKHYRTSLKAIVGVSASEDGALFASISANGEGRVFDVVNFDMINILKFGFTPKACCWVHAPGAGQPLLAVSDVASPTIRIYDGRGDSTPLFTLDKVHRAPVHLMVVSLAGKAVNGVKVADAPSTRPSLTLSSRQTRQAS